MKYDIDIFKTPSYQKIFKEVLKLRHPNLSEEEALNREFFDFKNQCMVLIELENEFISGIDIAYSSGASKREYDGVVYKEVYLPFNRGYYYLYPDNQDCKKSLREFAKNYEILGRPITISELVDVLNSKNEFKDYYKPIEEYGYYYQNNAIYKMRYFKSQFDGSKIFDPDIVVKFNKSINFLHELEEETLNKIVDELD